MQPTTLRVPPTQEERQTRRDRETELWKRWKYQGDQQALADLFESLRPLIKRIAMSYAGNLPQVSIEAKVKKWTLKALETWTPGVSQMNTWIQQYTQKVLRDVAKYQNLGRLPEASAFKVPSYLNMRANMTESLGREPTYGELADELKTTIAEIQRLESGTRKDLMHVEGTLLRPQDAKLREQEIIAHVMYELSPPEQAVMEMTFGIHGKREMTSAQIAAQLGIPVGRVNSYKHRIAGVVKKFYGGH